MSTTLFPPPPTKLQVSSEPRRRTPFRPDIEGLRAIAVLSVLAFHAAVPGLNGGFVGVDIFFVISGYLITGQLFAEGRSSRGISIGKFYARRARRILPPTALVLGATAVAMYELLPPLVVKRFLGDILSALSYVANWHFIAQGKNYLDSTQSDSIVLHCWSLAVEEQFYLVWPFLILLAVWIARRTGVSSRAVVLTTLGLVTAGSFLASYRLTGTDPGLAYMATYTRAWQFGVGGLVAVGLSMVRSSGHRESIVEDRKLPADAALILGFAGAAAIVWSLAKITATTPYPGLASLAPTLGTAALIAAGPTSLISRLIANPAFRAMGRWSFSWYLWHWPILILAEQHYGPLRWPVKVGLTLGSGVLAWLTYHFLEAPSTRLARAPREVRASFVAAATAMVLAFGSAGYVNLHTNESLAKQAAGVLPTGNALNPQVYRSIFLDPHGANSGLVSPSPDQARTDLASKESCQINQATLEALCTFGASGGKRVVLFGDSHADQWRAALGPIATLRRWSVTEFTESGCPAEDLAPKAGIEDHFSQQDCLAWRAKSIASIVAMKPALVIVSSYNHYDPDDAVVFQAWRTTMTKLAASGAIIAYLSDTPFPGFNVPECISGAINDWAKCAFTPRDRVDPIADAIRSGQLPGIRLMDMYPVLCPSALCPAVRGGVLLYRDETHITATAARLLAYPLSQLFTKAGIR